ncbi:MAG: c(7)-type cytochrome triheme domain-containing protein [Acidobacteriota bacterium]
MSRLSFYVVAVVCLVSAGCGGSLKPETKAAVAEPPKAEYKVAPTGPGVPPEAIHFASEYGAVRFTHREHFERVNNNCETCHPKIFPQKLEALNYGKARHRVAEEFKASCASCHGITGTAFAAERNCQKCHEMGLKQ